MLLLVPVAVWQTFSSNAELCERRTTSFSNNNFIDSTGKVWWTGQRKRSVQLITAVSIIRSLKTVELTQTKVIKQKSLPQSETKSSMLNKYDRKVPSWSQKNISDRVQKSRIWKPLITRVRRTPTSSIRFILHRFSSQGSLWLWW